MEKTLVDISSERAVLAGIFRYGSEAYYDISDIVTSDSFVDELHQILYACTNHILKETSNSKIDYPSILSAANTLGYANIISRPDELKLIRAIQNFPIHKDNVRKMAAIVRKLEVARQLARELDVAKGNIHKVTGEEPIDHILALAENPIFELTTSLTNSNTNGPHLIGQGVKEYIDYLASNPVDQVGISTGFAVYDRAIGGGLRRKTINLIGARPKIGKTSFGDNVAIHIAGQLNIPVLNLDTEMSENDHRVRILANLAEVPIEEIETGKFAQNSWKKEKIQKAVDKLEKMPYYYNSVAGVPFEEILAIARRWLHRVVGIDSNGNANHCVIIYDYLKLMNSEGLNKNMQEYQLLGFQISSLHNFMVRYDVPCLAFIQLNRDGISKEDTDVASGSDRQVWLCSNFSIFKKKSDEEMAENGNFNRKLVPLVERHGGGLDDGDYINMLFKGQYNKLIEGKTKFQLKDDKDKKSQGFVVNDTKPDETIPFTS